MNTDYAVLNHQDWLASVPEMDRLCRMHFDLPHSSVNLQSHYILVKLPPDPEDFPLQKIGGVLQPQKRKRNDVTCGLVVAIGRYAFTDGLATKWEHGPLCRLGEYTTALTVETFALPLNGYSAAYIRDDAIIGPTDNPFVYGDYGVNRFKVANANKIIFKKEWIEKAGLKCEAFAFGQPVSVRYMEDIEEEANAANNK